MLPYTHVLGTIRVYDELKSSVRNLVRASRSFFPENATQELLDEFRPLQNYLHEKYFNANRKVRSGENIRYNLNCALCKIIGPLIERK